MRWLWLFEIGKLFGAVHFYLSNLTFTIHSLTIILLRNVGLIWMRWYDCFLSIHLFIYLFTCLNIDLFIHFIDVSIYLSLYIFCLSYYYHYHSFLFFFNWIRSKTPFQVSQKSLRFKSLIWLNQMEIRFRFRNGWIQNTNQAMVTARHFRLVWKYRR